MNSEKIQSLGRIVALLSVLCATSGCASLVSSAAGRFADNLSAAVLSQDDPETARAAIPSYMILIDSMIEGNPRDPSLLSSAATLYASYGAVFADDAERARRLTRKARRYALLAMCETYGDACEWRSLSYDDFVASLERVPARHAQVLYTYGFATLAYLRAHSDDWNTLAELPQIEALFEHYLAIADGDVSSATHTYMGILLTLRPPALGGKPEEAKAHFEEAIELSSGRDLAAKVEYARSYAKLLYDRELHDRLLEDVLAADPYANELTLGNVLAQRDAAELLAQADDYF